MKLVTKIILLVASVASLGSCRGGGTFNQLAYELGEDIVVVEGDELVGCPEPPSGLPFEPESDSFLDQEAVDAIRFKSGKLQKANHYLFDVLGNEGVEQKIVGQATYGIELTPVLAGKPQPGISGEWVSLWHRTEDGVWTQLGRVQTADDGTFSYVIPESLQFEVGEHRIFMVVEGDKSCIDGGVFIYPKETEFIVTDIDETMTRLDSEMIDQISDPYYVPIANQDAVEMMQQYKSKNYVIIYLTARPFGLRLLTREWLEYIGLPFGPVITADRLVTDESAVQYKGGFLINAINELGWKLFRAYGNAESDIDAYKNAGLPSERTFIIGRNAGLKNTQPIDQTAIDEKGNEVNSYRQHIAEYVNDAPEAQQPF